MTWLVVGLGSPDGDDAVGPAVARAIAERHLPDVDVAVHEDPTGLLDVWAGRSDVVVVDAVRSGAEPGTVLTLEAGAQAEVLADRAWARTGRGGTHAFGLAAAVELGRALGRLPERLVLVGVEIAGVEHGAPLSAPVADALDEVVATVRRLVGPRTVSRAGVGHVSG